MDEMVGWHHGLNGHEFEQAPGAGDGQGSLACCSSCGDRIKHDLVTEQQQQRRVNENQQWITASKIKNTLKETNGRVTEEEEWISELEDKMVEITEAEQNKEKRMKRNEDRLRDLWDNLKCPNI